MKGLLTLNIRSLIMFLCTKFVRLSVANGNVGLDETEVESKEISGY